MSLPTLMVLDGELRATLGIVRSLGRRGIPIIVGSDSSLGRSGFSRYAQRSFNYPPWNVDKATVHSMVIQRVQEWRPDILMPLFGGGWSIIYAFYEEYARLTTIVPNPGRELFEDLSDKRRLVDYAKKCGVQIPMTFRPQTFDQALSLCESLPYPVLIKPGKSVGGIGIRIARNREEYVEALQQFPAKFPGVPLIQERIEGEDLELTLLCIHGEPIASSAYLSLRNEPIPYGPPVACRTIKDETLVRIGIDFLKELRYHGIAHLDFRRDKRDGQPKLLDFNPRIAGTNDASLCSGIDFAFMLYQLASGENVDPCFDYALGREFRWLMFGELRHLVRTNHKSRTLRDLLRWNNVTIDIAPTDPLPHMAMIVSGFRRLYQKLRTQGILA